jgi:hypothetical protein
MKLTALALALDRSTTVLGFPIAGKQLLKRITIQRSCGSCCGKPILMEDQGMVRLNNDTRRSTLLLRPIPPNPDCLLRYVSCYVVLSWIDTTATL